MTSQTERLSCSTRCQVVTTYDVHSHMIDTLHYIPKDLVAIMRTYLGLVDIPRSHENGPEVQRRWQQLQDNPLFQSIALMTDLFRFAIHGLENRLPKNLGEQFQFIEQRIPTLYPNEALIASIMQRQQSKITPVFQPVLDLPRNDPSVTCSSQFDPYHPETWGRVTLKEANYIEGAPLWQQRCRKVGVTATNKAYRDMYKSENQGGALSVLNAQQISLGSVITTNGPQSTVYCHLLLQNRGTHNNWFHFSWLPITRAALQSTSIDIAHTADWVLCFTSAQHSGLGSPFDFIYTCTSKQ